MGQMFFALIIPAVLTIVLLSIKKFREQTALWEYAIPYATTIAWIFIFYYIGIDVATKDKEYLGNYVTEIRYYEPWNEYIHRTCSMKVGKTTTYYDCSYVQYHSAHWAEILDDKSEIPISENKYNELKNRFNSNYVFYDMHRHYHSIDGDMYYTQFMGQEDKLEPYFSTESYTNKVQASYSTFNFPEVKEKDVKDFNLFEYPKLEYDNKYDAILSHGYKVPASAQKKFEYLNARLGLSKQVRVWVLLFNANERKSAYMQRGYWKGGNKNEFIACIGMNKDGSVAWFESMGWSQNKLIDVETRNYVLAQSNLDLTKFGDFMISEVNTNWVRTDFKQFDYLEIDVPNWAIWVTWIVSIVSCIGLSIWIVNNQFTIDDQDGDGY
jgi:hypothetical protein